MTVPSIFSWKHIFLCMTFFFFLLQSYVLFHFRAWQLSFSVFLQKHIFSLHGTSFLFSS
jgi:hypothetical protein